MRRNSQIDKFRINLTPYPFTVAAFLAARGLRIGGRHPFALRMKLPYYFPIFYHITKGIDKYKQGSSDPEP